MKYSVCEICGKPRTEWAEADQYEVRVHMLGQGSDGQRWHEIEYVKHRLCPLCAGKCLFLLQQLPNSEGE